MLKTGARRHNIGIAPTRNNATSRSQMPRSSELIECSRWSAVQVRSKNITNRLRARRGSEVPSPRRGSEAMAKNKTCVVDYDLMDCCHLLLCLRTTANATTHPLVTCLPLTEGQETTADSSSEEHDDQYDNHKVRAAAC